ncbi:HET domain-containing protein [Paraphaeosphaeria sporulosa]
MMINPSCRSVLTWNVYKGNPASTIIPRRPSVRKSWYFDDSILPEFISTCKRDHAVCNISQDHRMPTYLLKIPEDTAPEASIQLVHHAPCVGYAALSYCWGGDQRIKLTVETVAVFTTSGIPCSDLPMTIQDAITTTRKLGLQYVWIDALCIIQNDPVHTRREIDLMPSIYQNAQVTIYAARSSTVEQGFLSDIFVPGRDSHSFQIRIRGPDSLSRPGAPVCPSDLRGAVVCFSDDNGSNVNNPIEKRGWTFQELLLSPRLLEFGAYHTSYKCLELELCDANFAQLYDGRSSEAFELVRVYFHKQQMGGDLKIWETAVRMYTMRQLTNPIDRPLAISGIAAVLGRMPDLQGKYLAGLWKDELPLQLLWEIIDRRKPRSAEYRGPSWSWTAVDGTVAFLDHIPNGSPDRDLQILYTAIQLEDSIVPHGAVSQGSSITVRGWIIPKIVAEGGKSLIDIGHVGDATDGCQDEPSSVTRSKPWRPVGRYGPMPLIHPDAMDELTDGATVYCLEVYPFDEKTDIAPYGLILAAAVGCEVGFRRIGTFRFFPRVAGARFVSCRRHLSGLRGFCTGFDA